MFVFVCVCARMIVYMCVYLSTFDLFACVCVCLRMFAYVRVCVCLIVYARV